METSNVVLRREDLDAMEEAEPGEYLLLRVSDTGAGIPPHVLPRIFEPFFTTKEVGKGTGLGLSMIFGFVRQSRGQIRVESEVGKGTTVRLYLPRARELHPTTTPPVVLDPEALRGHESILLVEDDDMVRQYALGQLEALGYRVEAVAHGAAALAALRTPEPFDLLFTDLVMPGGIDGTQVARHAVAARPGLRVLYTSGYTEGVFVDRGTLDPPAPLLAKPYDRRELAARVREVLDD